MRERSREWCPGFGPEQLARVSGVGLLPRYGSLREGNFSGENQKFGFGQEKCKMSVSLRKDGVGSWIYESWNPQERVNLRSKSK